LAGLKMRAVMKVRSHQRCGRKRVAKIARIV
jgi:hypothetical protein